MPNRVFTKSVTVVLVLSAMFFSQASVLAQSGAKSDSVRRLDHLERAMIYGVVTGFAFAAVDQWQNDPSEWGKGWPGYGKRLASNVGEFVIQEGVTEGLAAVMHRPLDYQRCKCRGVGERIWWAAQGSVMDIWPNGKRAIAVPRIVGAYVGSFAQASWRPESGNAKLNLALINGTTSLALGTLINLVYEFRPQRRTGTLAGDRGTK